MNDEFRQAKHVELEPWEVGAELLDILSRGLYSDARDALREYVQNGVDAGASHITITIDGPSAVIRDDGSGMDDELMRAARRFGMSAKTPKEMVGYRGIGIYSAFGVCDEMTIMSRQSGMEGLVGWVFNFAEMRRILEADKGAGARQGIALSNLLREYTELINEPYDGEADDHFTVVRLEGMGEQYRAQLNDASGVSDYLLNTIPVAFPDDGYGVWANTWLEEEVGLKPVRISLRIGREPEFEIGPPLAGDVYKADKAWISRADGTKLAFVWYALSSTGRQLPTKITGAALSGFLMKMKGFTLGDRLTMKPMWPAVGGRTLYHHYTGEVHIVEAADVYPNAARDDLEPSGEKQQFVKAAANFFERLSRTANIRRAMTRASRSLDGLSDIVEGLKTRLEDPDEDAFELYREAKNHLGDLETAQRELLKLITTGRDRTPVELEPEHQAQLDEVKDALNTDISNVLKLVRSAQKRSERKAKKKQEPQKQVPPQIAIIEDALKALREAVGSIDDDLQPAVEDLETAYRLHSVSQAIGVLDEIKASGIKLPQPVETARRELRAFLAWSPLAPVSLDEALAQLGVSLASEREEAIVLAVDRALLAEAGGRGERYESTLRAVADAIADALLTPDLS